MSVSYDFFFFLRKYLTWFDYFLQRKVPITSLSQNSSFILWYRILFSFLASSSFWVVSKSRIYQMPCLLSKKTSADIPTGVFFLLFKASVVICTRKPLSISSVWSAGLQNTSRIISLLILFYLILPERKICNVILCAEGKRNFKSQLSPGFPCGTESLNAQKRGNSKARKNISSDKAGKMATCHFLLNIPHT